MAISITYNPNLYALYQIFYDTKFVDLVESLAWLINDEKSQGVSEEQGNLIVLFAHFYFNAIQTLEQNIDPTWTYRSWLSEEEYNKIIYKLELNNTTPNTIHI